MKKNILKTIVFLLILCMLLYMVFHILWVSPNAISYFYKEPKNSLDVIYIGSSNAYIHFNTTLAYDLYGITTGVLSVDAEPFLLTNSLIEESKKYQTPSLYIIDIAKAVDDLDFFSEAYIRKTIDAMKFSKNRNNAINEVFSYKKDINKKEYINWYFSFLMYHNSWKNISKYNIVGNKNLYKGYYFLEDTAQVEPQDKYIWKKDKMELQDDNKKILTSLIDYIKTNNLNVVFVVPIRCYDDETNGRLNTAIQIIKEDGLDVINFNTLDDFTIDFSTDLYNYAHINVYGSTKYTLYFSKYLKENYDLKNHKGDKNYNSWDSEYTRFKENYKKITKKDFDELLKEYNQ